MANFIRFLDKYDLHMINVDRITSIEHLISDSNSLSIHFDSGAIQIYAFETQEDMWIASNKIWEQLSNHG